MNILRTIVIGMMVSGSTLAAVAEEPSFATLTVTAKRPLAGAIAVERVAPQGTVDLMALIPIDMPEAAIDQHMAPIGPAAGATTTH